MRSGSVTVVSERMVGWGSRNGVRSDKKYIRFHFTFRPVEHGPELCNGRKCKVRSRQTEVSDKRKKRGIKEIFQTSSKFSSGSFHSKLSDSFHSKKSTGHLRPKETGKSSLSVESIDPGS